MFDIIRKWCVCYFMFRFLCVFREVDFLPFYDISINFTLISYSKCWIHNKNPNGDQNNLSLKLFLILASLQLLVAISLLISTPSASEILRGSFRFNLILPSCKDFSLSVYHLDLHLEGGSASYWHRDIRGKSATSSLHILHW